MMNGLFFSLICFIKHQLATAHLCSIQSSEIILFCSDDNPQKGALITRQVPVHLIHQWQMDIPFVLSNTEIVEATSNLLAIKYRKKTNSDRVQSQDNSPNFSTLPY